MAESNGVSESVNTAIPPIRIGSRFVRSCLLAGLVALASASHAQSDNPEEAAAACRDAAEFASTGDIEAALAEATWCLEVLSQIQRDETFAVFPDVQGDWTGGELENQSAMGMTLLSRSYSNGEQSIDVSVTTGPAGSGLAALAQLGATLGVGEGTKFRVQRRTVVDMSFSSDDQVHFLVELRNGGVMNVQSGSAGADAVRSFLEGFPVAEIDEALEG